MNKSTVEQIRERFDGDVERFSNLETGQSATIDAPLSLALIAEAAYRVTSGASSFLDVGCGAGNYALKLLEHLPNLDVTLVDLSRPMLDRAVERVSRATSGKVTALQGDIRELEIGESRYDIICAAAVLHHLRDNGEWHCVFSKFYSSLRAGGSLWISDLIEHSDARVQGFMWKQYGAYLTDLKNEAYRDHVWAYIAKEDSPRPLMFQLDLLREVGFNNVELLHKNSCFAAFGAIKSAVPAFANPVKSGEVPRSAFDMTGRIVYFARMLDKIRLHAAGLLRADFHPNLGSGFDGRCCRFLGIDYPALCKRVVDGGSDDDILAWCFSAGRRPNEEQILVWNKFMLKRGWRDEDDGSTQELESYKAVSGLADRADLLTFFDYYEVDEGRKPAS